jgi:hypothetical protein
MYRIFTFCLFFLLIGCKEQPPYPELSNCYFETECEKPWVHTILVDVQDGVGSKPSYYYIKPEDYFTYGHSKFEIRLSCDTGSVEVTLEGTFEEVEKDRLYAIDYLNYDDISAEIFVDERVITKNCLGHYILRTYALGKYTFARVKIVDKAAGTGDWRIDYWEYGKEVECVKRLKNKNGKDCWFADH